MSSSEERKPAVFIGEGSWNGLLQEASAKAVLRLGERCCALPREVLDKFRAQVAGKEKKNKDKGMYCRYDMWRIASKRYPEIESLNDLKDLQYEDCLKEVHKHLRKHRSSVALMLSLVSACSKCLIGVESRRKRRRNNILGL